MFKENTTYSARRELTRLYRHDLDQLPRALRVSTLRSAIELKNVFDQIQAAERSGSLSPEEKKRLEEQAAEKGIQALFKVSNR